MTRAVASLLSLHARRVNPPPHLRYPWQRVPNEVRRGAKVVDPEAFAKAMDAACPVDSFTATSFNKEA